MQIAGRSVSLVLVGLAACSGTSHPPGSGGEGPHDASTVVVAHDGSTTTDGARDTGAGSDGQAAGDGGAGDGPATDAGDAGDATGGQEGGGDDAGDAGFPPPPPAVCAPSATWAAGQLLSVSTPLDDSLDAITPDELSIVWTSGTGTAAALLYADRASTSSDFGTPQTVPAGAFAVDRAALSPDGLRLVVVNSDGQGFSELTRTSRSGAFGAPAVGTYTNLDGALAPGESYGDPVLSADDHMFYYSVFGNGETNTIFRASRLFGGDSWPAGEAVGGASALQAQGSLRRQPTGVSSDGQTLFFWDQVSGMERSAYLDVATGSFDAFVDLGPRAMAAPSYSCNALYYSAQGASSEDLFVAGH
jgi:hypothetical protein